MVLDRYLDLNTFTNILLVMTQANWSHLHDPHSNHWVSITIQINMYSQILFLLSCNHSLDSAPIVILQRSQLQKANEQRLALYRTTFREELHTGWYSRPWNVLELGGCRWCSNILKAYSPHYRCGSTVVLLLPSKQIWRFLIKRPFLKDKTMARTEICFI